MTSDSPNGSDNDIQPPAIQNQDIKIKLRPESQPSNSNENSDYCGLQSGKCLIVNTDTNAQLAVFRECDSQGVSTDGNEIRCYLSAYASIVENGENYIVEFTGNSTLAFDQRRYFLLYKFNPKDERVVFVREYREELNKAEFDQAYQKYIVDVGIVKP